MSDPLERVRRLCLGLPEATEKLAWGEPTFRIKGKMFATYADANNHHGGGKHAVWCPAPPSAQQGLTEAAPDRFFVPPYVGTKGWIGIWLDQVDDTELEFHLFRAYCAIAPARLQRLAEERASRPDA